MAGKRTGLRNENKGGPPTEGKPRVNSESPEHLSSPGSGGGGIAKTTPGTQSYAIAAMMGSPTNNTDNSSPARTETTKANSSIGGTKKSANKGKSASSGAAEESSGENDQIASKAKWTASHEGLKAAVLLCSQRSPLSTDEEPPFIIRSEFLEAVLSGGDADRFPAELLDEYKDNLMREYYEYIRGGGRPTSTGTNTQASERRRPTSAAPVLHAQFRAPSNTEMAKNQVAAKRVQTLNSMKSTAHDAMLPIAERLVISIAIGDVYVAQKHKVALASSSVDDLSIKPAEVVGPVEAFAADGNGASSRVFTLRDSDSDNENDSSSSFENSSDLGVRPRKPGIPSYNKAEMEDQAHAIALNTIEALNNGCGEDVLSPDIFKTDVVKGVPGKTKDSYAIRVNPDVYVKLLERSLANRRIRDAILRAIRQLLEKRNALDSVSRSKLQAMLTEHERIDSLKVKAQESFTCALSVDDEPSIFTIASCQIAPGLNVGVNIIEQVHDNLFDHENAQGISFVCSFVPEHVVVKKKANGRYETLRTAWNRVLTRLQHLSKRAPLEIPWNLYGFMVDDDGLPELLSHDNLARMLMVHITLTLSREPGYNRLQEMFAPSSLHTEVVAKFGVKQLMELIEFAEKEVEIELHRTRPPERQADAPVNQRKPVYSNLGGDAAFVATAEQAPLTSQRRQYQGPSPEFVQGHDFFGTIAANEFKSSNNAVHAVIATAKAVNDHSGNTAFESIGNLGLKMKHGTTWYDKVYADLKTTSGIRLLKDVLGMTPSHYSSMLAGKPDLQRLKNALLNTTLQVNTMKPAAVQLAAQQQDRGHGTSKGGKGWKSKGKGGSKGTAAAAAAAYDDSSDSNGSGGGRGGGGGGSSSTKFKAV